MLPTFRPSKCQTFDVFSDHIQIPLHTNQGFIPVERRCRQDIYIEVEEALGVVLLIPGFASNRHVFDLGGGDVRQGPCFMEYLAKHGFNVYAMDLRGTRESVSLGTPHPGSIKEFVEEDINSVVQYIQKRNKGKVYLIGHSMGGALACSYSVLYPDRVRGVVHLAGLHYYSLPWIGLLVDGHRAHSPDWIKRPVSHIVHGLVDAILKCLPIASAALSKVDSFSGNRISNLITRIRRIPIPLRTATEGLLELLSRLQPSTQYKLLNSEWIPYPWLPGSIDDIPAFMNRTVESPTIGVFFSVLCIATFDDLYRNHYHATKNSAEHSVWTDSLRVGQKYPLSEHSFPWWHELGPTLERFLKAMPHKVLYAFANKDQILKSENTRRGVVESHTRRHSLSYETEETSQSHIEKKWSDSNDSRDSGVDLMTPVATMDSPPELIKSKKSMSHESVFQGYTLPPEFTQIETQSQARLCDPYTFPLDVSFGHVDVLAGSKAEVMWEQIRVWLCEDARRRQRSV